VHPPSQLLLYLREFCPHSVAPVFPFKQDFTLARASADENEPEEFEGFRLSELAPRRRPPTANAGELNDATITTYSHPSSLSVA